MTSGAGDCPLCGRNMVAGPSVDLHHLKPKCKGGKQTIQLHKICHRKIHSVLTESELANYYHTVERLLSHPDIMKFVGWIQGKDPEFYTSHKESQSKRKRR